MYSLTDLIEGRVTSEEYDRAKLAEDQRRLVALQIEQVQRENDSYSSAGADSYSASSGIDSKWLIFIAGGLVLSYLMFARK